MDVLMILSGAAAHELRAEIEQRVAIVQEASPRVLVVRGEPAAIQALAALPELVTDAELARPEGSSVHEDLSRGERLFVDAWLARRSGQRRAGEGLSWDSPGYEAP